MRARWIDDKRLQVDGQRARVRSGVSAPEVSDLRRPLDDSAKVQRNRSELLTGSRVGNPASSPYKSRLEAAYSRVLQLELEAGEILGWKYEPFTLKLAAQRRYRPDFLVWRRRDAGCVEIELIEVKGRWIKNRRDGLTRLYWAAHTFPMFTWRLIWRERQTWNGQNIVA